MRGPHRINWRGAIDELQGFVRAQKEGIAFVHAASPAAPNIFFQIACRELGKYIDVVEIVFDRMPMNGAFDAIEVMSELAGIGEEVARDILSNLNGRDITIENVQIAVFERGITLRHKRDLKKGLARKCRTRPTAVVCLVGPQDAPTANWFFGWLWPSISPPGLLGIAIADGMNPAMHGIDDPFTHIVLPTRYDRDDLEAIYQDVEAVLESLPSPPAQTSRRDIARTALAIADYCPANLYMALPGILREFRR